MQYLLILAWFISTEYSAYRGRDEIYTVSGLYAGAHTAILYVMVNIVLGGGRALHSTSHPRQPGLIFPSWWNVRVRQEEAIATLCVLCVHDFIQDF